MKLKNLIPMLNVSDIQTSITFYKSALEFDIVSDPAKVTEWKWATIRSGNVELMLSESGGTSMKGVTDSHASSEWPCVYYFYPDDVTTLHSHLVKNGYKPTALKTTFYGMKEFSIQDPDGHLLNFGQDEIE